jgi:hypothetical protein
MAHTLAAAHSISEDFRGQLETRFAVNIVHIVTAIPPVVCGVGDYGFCINEQLGHEYGFSPRLYVPEPSHLATKKAADLKLTLQSAEAVILEYSPYGYQRYGIPWWLLRTLSQWKACGFGRRLVTIFHELYAVGRMWSSAFWTAPPQRYVTQKLAKLSDGAITTTRRQAEILKAWNPRMELALLAVPSNVGEIPDEQLNRYRDATIVAFGQIGTRKRLYLENQESWASLRAAMPAAVIHDLGTSTDLPISKLTGLDSICHGHLPPSEVSALLRSARFGVLDYGRSTLDKSGVFAAYCAHGVVPIVFRHSTPHSSAVREGRHFLIPSSPELTRADPLRLSQDAHRWYSDHNLRKHSRVIHSLLVPGATNKRSGNAGSAH